MKNSYGLHIGATLKRQIAQGFLADDLLTQILVRATVASDARMGGATLPAMSNSGSGNQDITATMPIVVVANFIDATRATSQSINSFTPYRTHIRDKLPRLLA